ncbi:MAG: hypothetical protein ABIH63_00055 [archaeon]
MSCTIEDKCIGYIQSRFIETKEYIRRELDVLESVNYPKNANTLLKQLPERIKLVIKEKTAMMRERYSRHKPIYMEMVAKELDYLSMLYLWTDGSFGELIAKTLKNLSKEFKPSDN